MRGGAATFLSPIRGGRGDGNTPIESREIHRDPGIPFKWFYFFSLDPNLPRFGLP